MPAKRTGTGFTNLQTYLGLNQGAAARMGNALASDVEMEGQSVNRGLDASMREFSADPTMQSLPRFDALMQAGAQAQNKANALGTNEGRATLLGQKYGQGTYGSSRLDAALTGQGAAGGRLEAARGAYGKLLERIGAAQTQAQQRVPPPAQAPQQPQAPAQESRPRQQPSRPIPDYVNDKLEDPRSPYGRGGWR